ncbi:MAG: AMIN domain-containing protein, partial [Desulfuromonadales bacterium]|nr:AMIN domain-containing protein [Desulfuromonadales bacterium]
MRRSIVLLSMFFLAMMAATASSVIAADSVSSVNIAEKRAELTASAGIEKIRYFTLDSPKRLVVDLYGVQPGEHSRAITLSDGFTSLRVGPYEDKTRFVFDVSGALFPTFKVNTENEQVVVTWQEARSAARQAQAEAPTVGSAQVTAIDFSTAGGKSTLLIDLKGEATASDPVLDGNRVQFAIKNATLPRALRRVFDTLAFPSAIHSVTPYLVNVAGQPEVRFNVLLKGKTPYQLQKTSDGYTFSVEDGVYATSFAAATGVMSLAVDSSSLQAARVDDVAAVETVPAAPRPLAVPIIETVAADEDKYSGEKTSLVFDNADVRDIL